MVKYSPRLKEMVEFALQTRTKRKKGHKKKKKFTHFSAETAAAFPDILSANITRRAQLDKCAYYIRNCNIERNLIKTIPRTDNDELEAILDSIRSQTPLYKTSSLGIYVEHEMRRIIVQYSMVRLEMGWRMILTYLKILCHKYGKNDELMFTQLKNTSTLRTDNGHKIFIRRFLERMDPVTNKFKTYASDRDPKMIPYNDDLVREFYRLIAPCSPVVFHELGTVENAIEYMEKGSCELLLSRLANPENDLYRKDE